MRAIISFYALATVFVILALLGEFVLPAQQSALDKLLYPGMLLATQLPGGLAHNPLNIPIGLGLQAALIGSCLSLVRLLWLNVSKRISDARSDQ